MNAKMVKTLLAAACLSIAALASPALAQSSPGSKGSGEVPRTAPGDVDLPRVVPMELPKVDPDEIGRDLVLDPEEKRRSFGTVTRTREGEEIREAPGEDILRTLEGAGVFPGADPAFEEEGERQVFGEDERVQVTDSTRYPFRVFGWLLGKIDDEAASVCSATLVGPRTLLTAAHCLYSHEDDGWMLDYAFLPGANGLDFVPYGVHFYESVHVFEGYITNYRGFYGSVLPWDVGVVILEEPIGDDLGWMGFAHEPELGNFLANIIGYPADKEAGTLWRTTCDVPREQVGEGEFWYFCDTYQGSSGAAVYKYDAASDDRIIYGVNVAESPVANIAVRLNATYFAWVSNLVR